MPDPQPNSTRVIEALSRRLLETPPATKEEAEVQKVTMEAVASLVAAEKMGEELLDAKRPETIRRKKLEYWMNKIGVSATLLGVGGSIYFFVDTQIKSKEVAAQKVTIGEIKNREDMAKTKEDLAKQQEEMSIKSAEAAKKAEKEATEATAKAKEKLAEASRLTNKAVEDERMAKESMVKALAIERDAKLHAEIAEAKATETEGSIKEAGERDAVRQKREAMLSRALEELPKEVKAVLSKSLAKDNPVILAMGEVGGRAPASAVTDEEIARMTAEAEKLFSDTSAMRVKTYNELTTGKERTNPALPIALLNLGKAKLADYAVTKSAAPDNATRKRLFELRRGLENVVVTMRDISRSATQKDEGVRQQLLAFADSLVPLESGVAEEANSLKRWLNTKR